MIRAIIMDVDGTLTDGKINISGNGELFKSFSIKDGMGISMLSKYNILSIIITGRDSEIVRIRSEELKVNYLYQGISDKSIVLKNIVKDLNIDFCDIAYIGDDINDISCMKLCAIAGCPNDSVSGVKEVSDYICNNNGGNGAVREFIEYLLEYNKGI